MAEELQEQGTETVKKEMLDIESQVKEAMVSRVIHFKEQAEWVPSLSLSLTCEVNAIIGLGFLLQLV